MPTTTQIGQSGPANDKIGGVPTVHYFDFFSKGRGQVVRLLFLDAGIAFTDVRYTFEEFPRDIRPALMAPEGLNPTGNLPVVELNGQAITQSYPILRHFSRVLGNAYDGDSEAEMFWVDRICDIVIDWRTKFVDSYFSSNQKEDYVKHCEQNRSRYMNALERHLTQNELARKGPYVCGGKFTYADMVLFQVLHDEELGKGDMNGVQDYPRLKKVVEAVRSRPNVKAFLESEEYKG
jgi:prostaglandin-H2 D-isomerase / glutathione transferase